MGKIKLFKNNIPQNYNSRAISRANERIRHMIKRPNIIDKITRREQIISGILSYDSGILTYNSEDLEPKFSSAYLSALWRACYSFGVKK
jgi:hypothetical protein